MNKIKEHHDVERQVRGWQIGLAEGAFSRGMGQAAVWEQSSPFPLLSLSVLFFPVISPAPHLSPLPGAHVKARVSPTVASFSSIQQSESCSAGQACPAPWLLAPSRAPRAAALSRAWRSRSFCFPVEYLMRFQFPHYNALQFECSF